MIQKALPALATLIAAIACSDADPAEQSEIANKQQAAPPDGLPGLIGERELVGCGDGREIDPESDALTDKASALLGRSMASQEAVTLLKQAIEIDPRNVIAINRLTIVYLHDQQRSDLAIKMLEAAILELPECGDLRAELGASYTANKEYENAKENIQKAIAMTPTPIGSYHYNLANAYLSSGDPGGAIPIYRRALEIDPSHKKAKNNLAIALYRTGNADALLSIYAQDADALRRLGVQFARDDNPRQAIVFHKKSLALEDTADTHYNLGLSYALTGDFKRARIHADKALALNPNDPATLKMIELLDAQ